MDHRRADAFRRLHQGTTAFVLPNAWDAMSARALESAGAQAIGTTSAGISWSYGRPDGQTLSRDEMTRAIGRIVHAVQVPVTADIESGYGRRSPSDVAETVRRVAGIGAIGINLEDSPGEGADRLLPVSVQAGRLGAARAAALREGIPIFINARIDSYLLAVGNPNGRLAMTIERAHAFVDAGADGIFVPGLLDPERIRELAGSLSVPVNVMATGEAPGVEALSRLGVRRISLGPGLAQLTLAGLVRAARTMLTELRFDTLGQAMSFGEAEALFSNGRRSADITAD